MKKLILSLIFLSAFTLLHAQIQEAVVSMSQGSKNALYIDFENARDKDIEDLWIKFARDLNGKTDKVKKSDEYMTDDAAIEKMSDNTIDVYALARQEGDKVRFLLWFDLGGAYLSSREHPDRIGAGRKLLTDFATTVAVQQLEDALKEQEDLLKKMAKDLADLEKEQAGLEKDIADYEKKIEEAREGIREAQKNQETQRQAIQSEEKRLKELEDQLKSEKKKM